MRVYCEDGKVTTLILFTFQSLCSFSKKHTSPPMLSVKGVISLFWVQPLQCVVTSITPCDS